MRILILMLLICSTSWGGDNTPRREFYRGVCDDYDQSALKHRKSVIPIYHHPKRLRNDQKYALYDAINQWNVVLQVATGGQTQLEIKGGWYREPNLNAAMRAFDGDGETKDSSYTNVIYFLGEKITGYNKFTLITEYRRSIDEFDSYVYGRGSYVGLVYRLVHELGHALGLEDGAERSIMGGDRIDFFAHILKPVGQIRTIWDAEDQTRTIDEWGISTLIRPQFEDVANIACLYDEHNDGE